MTTQTTRRALIGGAGLASVALIAPAVAATASTGSPEFSAILDANDAAARRFNALPEMLEVEDPRTYEIETVRMINASRLADRATPTTWQQFVRLLNHQCDGGLSSIDDDNTKRLLAHATRLLNKDA